MSEAQAVDLTNCDREPIHIPGSIQPHGALIAFDMAASIAQRHSANAPDLLGLGGAINGATMEELLGGEATHSLRNALSTVGNSNRPALLPGLQIRPGGRFDVAIHRFKTSVIVEFEPAGSESAAPLQIARTMIDRISRTETVEALMQQAARLVRGTLGYDRVMVYQFQRDGSGKVASEAKRADLESFLGQYFPATDIPQQARLLYLRNTIRLISDASFRPVPLVPVLDMSGEPLDLSFAHLRSVSPVHCEYLRNMGVGASMSISVIVDGELWGMITCHHYSPRVLSMSLRVAAEMFGEFFSLHLSALRHKQKLDTAKKARIYLDRLLQLATGGDIETLLRAQLPGFAALLPNDGFGLYHDGKWTSMGAAPPEDEIERLSHFIGTVAEGRVWATHSLVQHLPEAGAYPEAAGVLAIPLSQLPRDYLFFFRREMVQTLNWAGNPEKSYETGPLGDRLTPRKSFAIWKETVHQQAQPWTEEDRDIAESTRAALVEVVLRHNELMAEERNKADVRQRMLNEELNHRVKNILAVIGSLVSQPVQDGRTLRDYVETLRGRIHALAVAHDQVIRGDGGGQFRDLAEAELSPYRTAGRIALDGPDIWVDSRAFSVLALVLHELATNAAKYGALSVSSGRLSISWRLDAYGDCHIDWLESGGPEVRPPTREGFGTALLDRSIPYDLGGKSNVTYAPGGIEARFCIPARHVRAKTPDVSGERIGGDAPVAVTGPSSQASHILVVEDQLLIAMDVEVMLVDSGYRTITLAGSAEEALQLLGKGLVPDIALLDINLGTGTSIPVALELHRKDVPFIFATGYGEGSMIPEQLKHVPVVRKPYTVTSVAQGLSRALARGRG